VGRGGDGLERGGGAQAAQTGPGRGGRALGERVGLMEGKEVDWQRLMPSKGFKVLPRRWVVERTFSWLSQNRRMSKDYERLPESSEAFIYAAMSRLMARRLARA
jgi:hypothetical protein